MCQEILSIFSILTTIEFVISVILTHDLFCTYLGTNLSIELLSLFFDYNTNIAKYCYWSTSWFIHFDLSKFTFALVTSQLLCINLYHSDRVDNSLRQSHFCDLYLSSLINVLLVVAKTHISYFTNICLNTHIEIRTLLFQGLNRWQRRYVSSYSF